MTEVNYILSIIIKSSNIFSFVNAIIAIFIPIAIMIYGNSGKNTKFKWDKIVILDYVIKAKNIFFSFISTCALSLFWIDSDCSWEQNGEKCLDITPIFIWKLITVFILLYFVYVVIYSMIGIYNWLKNPIIQTDENKYKTFHQKKREAYLRNIPDKQAIAVWNDTWNTIQKDDLFLTDYLDIFIDYITAVDEDIFYSVSFSFINNIKNMDYSRSEFQDKILKLDDDIDDTEIIHRIKPYKDSIIHTIIRCYIEDNDPYVHLKILFSNPEYIYYFYEAIIKSYEARTLKNDERLLRAFSSVKAENIIKHSYTNTEKIILSAFAQTIRPILNNYSTNGSSLYDTTSVIWSITFGYTPHLSKRTIYTLILLQPYIKNLTSNDKYILNSTLKRILDRDYGYIFLETISIGRSFDQKESIEERREQLRNLRNTEIINMARNGISIYEELYGNKIDIQTIEKILKIFEQFKKDINRNSDTYINGVHAVNANLYDFIDTLKSIKEALRLQS